MRRRCKHLNIALYLRASSHIQPKFPPLTSWSHIESKSQPPDLFWPNQPYSLPHGDTSLKPRRVQHTLYYVRSWRTSSNSSNSTFQTP